MPPGPWPTAPSDLERLCRRSRVASSANFPLLNPLQSSLHGATDAFVSKVNASGTLAYSTFRSGTLMSQESRRQFGELSPAEPAAIVASWGDRRFRVESECLRDLGLQHLPIWNAYVAGVASPVRRTFPC